MFPAPVFLLRQAPRDAVRFPSPLLQRAKALFESLAKSLGEMLLLFVLSRSPLLPQSAAEQNSRGSQGFSLPAPAVPTVLAVLLAAIVLVLASLPDPGKLEANKSGSSCRLKQLLRPRWHLCCSIQKFPASPTKNPHLHLAAKEDAQPDFLDFLSTPPYSLQVSEPPSSPMNRYWRLNLFQRDFLGHKEILHLNSALL